MVNSRQRGFTLIELVVALAISCFLVMLAIPFTVRWLDSARQMQARGDLADAVGRAKAMALRNADKLSATAVAARLRLNGRTVEVQDSSGTVVWSAELPDRIALRKSDSSNYVCSAYNTRGWLISDGASCSDTSSQLLVSIGGQENLSVELL